MNKKFVTLFVVIIIWNVQGCSSNSIMFARTIPPLPSNTISTTFTATIIPYYSQTKTPTITPVTYPTINTQTFKMNKWSIDLFYDISAKDNPKSYIDLDTMEIGESLQSDLQYEVSGGSSLFHSLYPMNAALAKSMGSSDINLENCINDINSLDKYLIPELYSGNHICILSNKGKMFVIVIGVIYFPENTSISKLPILVETEI